MSVLVIGAGLIGTHVAAVLANSGQKAVLYDQAPDPDYIRLVTCTPVQVISGDVLDQEHLLHTMKATETRAVIHTAALLGRPMRNDPVRGVQVNVTGTAAVAEAALRVRLTRLVFCSSLTVYGGGSEAVPYSEAGPTAPVSMYGATKLAAEELLQGYVRIHRLPCVIVRPAGVYGRAPARTGGGLAQLLRGVLAQARSGKEVSLPPALASGNEYLYVRDATAGILRAMALGSPGRVYNIATGRLVSGQELAGILQDLFPAASISCPAAPGTHGICLDPRRAIAELGFELAYTLGSGLKEWLSTETQAAEELC